MQTWIVIVLILRRLCLTFFFAAFAAGGLVYAADAKKEFAVGFDQLKAGNFQAAADTFEKGLKIEPNNALAVYYLGEAYAGLSRDGDAHTQYRLSVSLDPKSSVADDAAAKISRYKPPAAKTEASYDETVAWIQARTNESFVESGGRCRFRSTSHGAYYTPLTQDFVVGDLSTTNITLYRPNTLNIPCKVARNCSQARNTDSGRVAENSYVYVTSREDNDARLISAIKHLIAICCVNCNPLINEALF